ncbi:Protein vip1 [Sphaceloma murrayae]|uniref:Protein vip1 n=1 Tax=Sphaceloma murrayae TaxID=2082308 RepID=A0A2K1QM35_9PEZI|nr:Protein vip1 [Sphaceloma murrayae]
MSSTVHVQNISAQTGEKEVRDFFSFCGKISSLKLESGAEKTQSATVTFEKETAAKTALLLDHTQLGPNQVQVTSDSSSTAPAVKVPGTSEETSEEIGQEDKPRSRILAEYLAHGYTVSDKAIEKAIALDNQHGISNRFTSALQNFDAKYKATERAQAADAKYKVSATGQSAWQSLNSYFEKALETPTGQRIRSFYVQGNKQVLDVHNEARHLADLKAGKAQDMHPSEKDPNRTECSCSANLGKCPCAPGKCACSGCGKNPDAKTTSKIDAETAGLEKVPGTEKTKCNCGADLGKCPCEPGKCACNSCPKNAEATASA